MLCVDILHMIVRFIIAC